VEAWRLAWSDGRDGYVPASRVGDDDRGRSGPLRAARCAWVRAALTGLQVAVVGLLAAALWQLARSEAGSAPLIIVLLAAFAAGLFVNAALVVGAAGAIGVAIDRIKRDP
jgi:chromate transport protein ChrA